MQDKELFYKSKLLRSFYLGSGFFIRNSEFTDKILLLVAVKGRQEKFPNEDDLANEVSTVFLTGNYLKVTALATRF